jgi:polyisoprenoid-binding protein YceI
MRHSLFRPGVIVILGSVGLGGILVAQTPPPQGPAQGARETAIPKPTPPAAWRVDPNASRVNVKVGAEGYGHVHGIQGRLTSGTVELGGGGELVFDMKSFAADPPEARQALGLSKPVSRSDQRKITANMLGADVLDVAHHPRAVFAIAATRPLDGQAVGDPGRYQLQGEFTLHGVRRPLQLIATVEPSDRPSLFRMRGAFSILQSEYGMTPYSTLGGIVRVADKVEIWGDLVLGDESR